MVDKINVEIPLDLAKKAVVPHYYGNPDVSGVMELVKAALPPEPTYEEGQLARVTTNLGYVFIGEWDGGAWVRTRYSNNVIVRFTPDEVLKVEPLQVAGEGEMVVPRPALTASTLNAAIKVLEGQGFYATALFLRGVARRL